MKSLSLALAVIASLGTATALAATYDVYPDGSGEMPTIQAAIDFAVTGDGIRVFSGTYYEDDLLIEGKDLTLVSQGGLAVLVSSLPGSNTGMTIRNVGTAFTMTGFEFRGYGRGVVMDNAAATFWYSNIVECGTGIEMTGAPDSPRVMYCLVDSCGTGVLVSEAFSGALLRNMTIVNCGTGIEFSGGAIDIRQNIVYGCDLGMSCSESPSGFVFCNNFWLNDADVEGLCAGAPDLTALPMFCFAAGGAPGPYYLHEDSPCWAENNTCGYDIGAFVQLPGCSGTAVEHTTWGAIKRIYR